MLEDGIDLQVVEATARYKAPARFDDELDLTIEVTKLGTTSMVTALAIHRDGTLLVEGELVHVFVDVKTLTKLPDPGPPPGGAELTQDPSDAQMSTLVRTLSTTASVNSLVVAWPPRSTVFRPPAIVSSTPS